MTETVTNELILEHLKRLQADVAGLRTGQQDIRDELRAMKGHIAALVQSDLNRDSQQGGIYERLERIERRLELTEG